MKKLKGSKGGIFRIRRTKAEIAAGLTLVQVVEARAKSGVLGDGEIRLIEQIVLKKRGKERLAQEKKKRREERTFKKQEKNRLQQEKRESRIQKKEEKEKKQKQERTQRLEKMIREREGAVLKLKERLGVLNNGEPNNSRDTKRIMGSELTNWQLLHDNTEFSKRAEKLSANGDGRFKTRLIAVVFRVDGGISFRIRRGEYSPPGELLARFTYEFIGPFTDAMLFEFRKGVKSFAALFGRFENGS